MLAQYTYIKPRSQFGKQCIFSTSRNVAEENIWPDPTLMQAYILRTHSHVHTQASTQYAAHEVQTPRRIMVNTGVLHDEGGWPKEVNSRDGEVVQRFRRRVEKGDNWVACMNKLIATMQRCMLQNSAVNIHQNYFDDLIPTSMAKEYSIRVTNLYEDPEAKMRPIRHLSWSPNGSNRLAAAYGFLEFEEQPADVSPYSYVWDIENPNKALYTLKSSSPLMTVEFNARDPVLLVSGLITGQVCCWDIRMSEKPVHITHVYTSHRHPATQTLWINSKTNTEFFSSSTDGMILWWDSRYLKRPTETLVVDLENPSRASLLKSVGVTALQFEPTMTSRFLAGTENGIVLSVNRRGQNPMEKLALRFECCSGPVVAIDRNPIYTKNFLTIGDWCAKVWADDTREGFFFSACNDDVYLSGGCWSRSRCSVFYTISNDGMLYAYDILAGVKTPLTTIRLCSDNLTAINSHEDGELLAVGSRNGNIYLLECSEDLTTFTKDEKLALSNYLDRCSRYEKAIDTRLREIRLIYASTYDMPHLRVQHSKIKAKKKDVKEKKKEKHVSIVRERRTSQKKSKAQRPKVKSTVKTSFPHLIEVETNYFQKIEQEYAKYEPLDEADMEAAQSLLTDRISKVLQEEEAEVEKEDLKRVKSMKKMISRTRTIRSSGKIKEVMEEELLDEAESTLIKKKRIKERPQKSLKKSCVKIVCKPKICCMDMEGKHRAKSPQRMIEEDECQDGTPERRKSFVVENKYFRRLSDYIAAVPPPPRAFQRKILAMKSAPPNILRGELEEARKEIRAWQEKAIARKLSSWDIERKLQERSDKMIEARYDSYQERRLEGSDVDQIIEKTVFHKDELQQMDDRPARKKPRARKGKEYELTDEDIQKQEEEKQKELWNLLKKQVMRYDESQKFKQFYPRISAAFVKTSFDATEDDPEEGKK